jgi:hypothetical protein
MAFFSTYIIGFFLFFFLGFFGRSISSTTGSSTTGSDSGTSTRGTNVQEKFTEVLALESLGVQGEPDGFNFNTSSLDKGLELVGLDEERK